MGRAFGPAGVHYRGIVCLLYHAFDGRNAVRRTGNRLVRRLRTSLYESVFRLSHRLVLLVYVDGGRDIGNYRYRGLRPVLVPGYGAVDTGADCRWAGGAGEPGKVLAAVRLYGEIEFWFAMIKVTTIIVMIAVAGRHFLWLWQRRTLHWL